MRLNRWWSEINPEDKGGIQELPPLDQFITFYNYRLTHLMSLGLPVFRYEDFVADPDTILRQVLSHLGLGFESTVLTSHQEYRHADVGHGTSDLSKPVTAGSLFKYTKYVTERELDYIALGTAEVVSALGYKLKWGTTLHSPFAD
jgi:hypothetical protein